MGKIIEFPYERVRVRPLPDPLLEELKQLQKEIRDVDALEKRLKETFGEHWSSC